MKKIKDERLQLENLKNIRIAYIVETVGVIGIPAYDLITGGMEHMAKNPVWPVLAVSSVVLQYLNMGISVDYESDHSSPKKQLMASVIILGIVSVFIGILVSASRGFQKIYGIFTGALLLIAGLIPTIHIYRLRKEKREE